MRRLRQPRDYVGSLDRNAAANVAYGSRSLPLVSSDEGFRWIATHERGRR